MATILSILSAIGAVTPLIMKLIGLFVSTPKPAREQLLEDLNKYIKEVHDAVDKAKDSEGDTSQLEDLINSRRK